MLVYELVFVHSLAKLRGCSSSNFFLQLFGAQIFHPSAAFQFVSDLHLSLPLFLRLDFRMGTSVALGLRHLDSEVDFRFMVFLGWSRSCKIVFAGWRLIPLIQRSVSWWHCANSFDFLLKDYVPLASSVLKTLVSQARLFLLSFQEFSELGGSMCPCLRQN